MLQVYLVFNPKRNWDDDEGDRFEARDDYLIDGFLDVLGFTICDEDAYFVEELVVYLLVVDCLDDVFEVSGP